MHLLYSHHCGLHLASISRVIYVSLMHASLLCMHAAGNLSLIRNKSFILLALVYAVNMAIIITWQTLIDEFLDELPGFSISGVVRMLKMARGSHASYSNTSIFSILHIQLIRFFADGCSHRER